MKSLEEIVKEFKSKNIDMIIENIDYLNIICERNKRDYYYSWEDKNHLVKRNSKGYNLVLGTKKNLSQCYDIIFYEMFKELNDKGDSVNEI